MPAREGRQNKLLIIAILPLPDSGLVELPALRCYQARIEDAGSGLQAVSDSEVSGF